MAEAVKSPLGPEHLAALNAAMAQLKDAEAQIELAKRAGVTQFPNGHTLAEYEQAAKEAKDKLLAIKQVYFPNA